MPINLPGCLLAMSTLNFACAKYLAWRSHPALLLGFVHPGQFAWFVTWLLTAASIVDFVWGKHEEYFAWRNKLQLPIMHPGISCLE
jgi:hypothetical protein